MKAVTWVPRSVRSIFSRTEEYVLLTTSPTRTAVYRRRNPCSLRGFMHLFSLRKVLVSVTLVPMFLLLAIFCQGVPPRYDDIRAFERRLPQHSLAMSKNQHQPQYVRFPGHLWGYGFNNILQETFVLSLPFAPFPPLISPSDSEY